MFARMMIMIIDNIRHRRLSNVDNIWTSDTHKYKFYYIDGVFFAMQ